MTPLTIVHVSTQRGWRGGEEQARLLVRGLASRGHRSVIFARDGGQFAERMAPEGFEVRLLPGSGRGLKAMWRMRGWLQSIRPDVLHYHDAHALSGAGWAAWRLSIPARIMARRVDFPIRSLWRYRRLADRVIAVSHAVADVCRESGLENELLRVVHDGVDPARARSGDRDRGRRALGVREDQPLLVCVASLTDHKGHTFLLNAMPRVLAHFPNARLALAGDGELRDALEIEAHKLGISHAVEFLGYRNDVPDLIRAADLFVLPSHMEGLCSTLIDVMFARVPIVATTAGGIPEVLGAQNGELPVANLFPPRNPQALAAEIIDALKKLPRQATLVDRAEQRANRLFTADQMVEGTLAIYREVLDLALRTMNRNTARAA